MRARYTGDVPQVFPDFGPYHLDPGAVVELPEDEGEAERYLRRPDFEEAPDAELSKLRRVDEELPAPEPEPEPTLEERIQATHTHRHLRELAVELGVEVPEEPSAPWGDAKTVPEKQAALTAAVNQGDTEEASDSR